MKKLCLQCLKFFIVMFQLGRDFTHGNVSLFSVHGLFRRSYVSLILKLDF